MATTPPKDDETKDVAPAPPADTPPVLSPDPVFLLHDENATTVEVLAFRYTAEVAAQASRRLEELDTLLWFKELDDWQKSRVRNVLAAHALSQDDQLVYTLAALLTGMELYIEALQRPLVPVA
jgi:hypothetical protein